MKANETAENDRPLRQVLREWKMETPLPPRFREEVWRRIARAETQPAPTPLAWFSCWVEVLLPRPKFALSYVAALMVFGIAAGTLAAQVTARRLNADLGLRYVQSIDPYHADTSGP